MISEIIKWEIHGWGKIIPDEQMAMARLDELIALGYTIGFSGQTELFKSDNSGKLCDVAYMVLVAPRKDIADV